MHIFAHCFYLLVQNLTRIVQTQSKMACQVQNQYQRYEQSSPSILAHHELVLKKLSALSMYMEAQGKGASAGVSGSPDGPNSRNSEAARDWYGEGNSHSVSGQPNRSAARPIPTPAFQFSAQSAAPPLSTSAPSVNPISHSSPPANPPLPRVASFSNGWHHENVKPDRGRESLAASAARFYEQKRRASIASHKAHTQGLRSPSEHGNCALSPLGRSPALFYPRECSQDSLERLGSSRRSSPGEHSGDGGFFFAPGDKHRVLSHFSSSPTSSLSSILSAGGSGDSNPVSPNRTDSDGSGNSSSMDGATKPLARNWDMEAESALAQGGQRSKGAEEDKLAPLVGRGLRYVACIVPVLKILTWVWVCLCFFVIQGGLTAGMLLPLLLVYLRVFEGMKALLMQLKPYFGACGSYYFLRLPPFSIRLLEPIGAQ